MAEGLGMIADRSVFRFGPGGADGDASMRNLLGGKGANLAEMCKLGLPVPPGFTITTAVCNQYYAQNRRYPEGLADRVDLALKDLESETGKIFGDKSNPLLVSVRSGARASMPGMMDTVLNLGLNDETADGLAALSGDRRFAFDSYRRFIQMYGQVVLGIAHEKFEMILDEYKERHDLRLDTALSAEDWGQVISRYKAMVAKATGEPFPQSPRAQLWGAIGAVFASWMNDRAKTYRRLNDIPESWGTAVNIQSMVFGNLGETSATGVAFTRDPNTGAKSFFGEFLPNAQGEDVVAGIRTPIPITAEARALVGAREPSMEEAMPAVYQQLRAVADRLEAHYRDMQDIEFTVERGVLYMLQTRNGKRTTPAALKIAVDMAREGLISERDAVLRIDPQSLDQLLHPTIAPDQKRDLLTKGLPASPGAATGQIVFSAEEAEKRAAAGIAVILVRDETDPKDIHGMHAAKGVLTSRGGMTSHAAVVARGMGRPCVVGAGEMRVYDHAKTLTVRGREIGEGEILTIDGSSGEVMLGAVRMIEPELTGDFAHLMGWADKARRMAVRANAETPRDVQVARSFGAEGVGLCRTEHMFFDDQRIAIVRQMILADTVEGRRAALSKLLPIQRQDFEEIFEIMEGLPCTIRLLDPPLHEFLPHSEEDVADIARSTGVSAAALMTRAKELHEVNPMLGHRGCRLALTFPEIYEMQARAIFEAAVGVFRRTGKMPRPEIMVPLIATRRELEILRKLITEVGRSVAQETGVTTPYQIGTMIELPRAALRADEIAHEAEFFSFGTNDLTQTALGISRDDAGRFLNAYLQQGVFEKDPFASLDQTGVGDLVRIAFQRGRATKSTLKIGVCGEHGGDPASIAFFESVGLDYVSCSPYRVPIARLSAAQAALRAMG